jgi:hypothetical protein
VRLDLRIAGLQSSSSPTLLAANGNANVHPPFELLGPAPHISHPQPRADAPKPAQLQLSFSSLSPLFFLLTAADRCRPICCDSPPAAHCNHACLLRCASTPVHDPQQYGKLVREVREGRHQDQGQQGRLHPPTSPSRSRLWAALTGASHTHSSQRPSPNMSSTSS